MYIKNIKTILIFFGLPLAIFFIFVSGIFGRAFAESGALLLLGLLFAFVTTIWGIIGIIKLYRDNQSFKARRILTYIIVGIVFLFIIINFLLLPWLNTFPGL